MNHKKLYDMTKLSQTASDIMHLMMERQRNTVYTAFSSLRADMKKKYGREVDREAFDTAFKKLEEIGAGKVNISKRGACVGFFWSTPIRKIGSLLKNHVEAGQVVIQQNVPPKTGEYTVILVNHSGEAQAVKITPEQLKALNLTAPVMNLN